MFNKYPTVCSSEVFTRGADVGNWSRNHKTIITLNGGNNASLVTLMNFLCDPTNPYAWVHFHEDEESLGSVMTGVGIVLPAKIYETAERLRNREVVFADDLGDEVVLRILVDFDGAQMDTIRYDTTHSFTPFEIELIETLNRCRLAS
jgi:hypothetical protein